VAHLGGGEQDGSAFFGSSGADNNGVTPGFVGDRVGLGDEFLVFHGSEADRSGEFEEVCGGKGGEVGFGFGAGVIEDFGGAKGGVVAFLNGDGGVWFVCPCEVIEDIENTVFYGWSGF